MVLTEGGGRPVLLVLRALGLGDFLTAIPALRALENAFPQYGRLLAAPEWLRPLAGLAGWEVVPFSLEGDRRLTLQDPAHEPVEMAVNLHGKGPRSHKAILPLEPHSFLAFEHKDVPQSHGFPIHNEGEHEVRRWCRLLVEFGIPADPDQLHLQMPAPAPDGDRPFGLPAGVARGATLIHPGAASAARRWPSMRWAEIARARASQGNTVLLTGSAGEKGLCEQVRAAAGLPPEANLAGKTDLIMLGRLVAEAGLALSADTGFAHLATAFGTPSVVLFGPVPPRAWGPPPDQPQHHVIWKGRLGDPHASRPDPGLLQIQVAEVLEAIEEVGALRVSAG